MPLLSTNQLTPGGRNFNKDYPYIVSNVKEKPTVTVNGITTTQLDFADGVIEFDDLQFSLDGLTFDLNDLGSLVKENTKYVVAAVPGYDEPISQAAAEAANVDYYVTTSAKGETLLHYYIPAAIEAQVAAAGGMAALQELVLGGNATQAQVSLYNSYKQAEQKNLDPRTSVGVLTPSKVEFVLLEVVPQSNYSEDNYFLQLNKNEFLDIRSKTPALTKIKVLSEADAIARYAGVEHVVKSAYAYGSEADAINNNSGVAVDLSSGVAATIFAGSTFVRVVEYYVSSTTEISKRGEEHKVLAFLTKKDSTFLGRTHPILLANESYSAVFGRSYYSPLTRDPSLCGMVEVSLSGGVVSIDKEIFKSYLD